jgi:hypothetical protein
MKKQQKQINKPPVVKTPAYVKAIKLGLLYMGFNRFGFMGIATHEADAQFKTLKPIRKLEEHSSRIDNYLEKNRKAKLSGNLHDMVHGDGYTDRYEKRNTKYAASIQRTDLSKLSKKLAKLNKKFNKSEREAIDRYTGASYSSINNMLWDGKLHRVGKTQYEKEEEKKKKEKKCKPPKKPPYPHWSDTKFNEKYKKYDDWMNKYVYKVQYNHDADTYRKIMNLDSAFEKVHMPEELIVYRGPRQQDIKRFETAKPGDIFCHKGYMSTSLLPFVALGFGENGGWSEESSLSNMMVIRVPKDSKAIYIADFSGHETEQEVLLARGAKLKLIRIDKRPNGGRYIFDYIGNNK